MSIGILLLFSTSGGRGGGGGGGGGGDSPGRTGTSTVMSVTIRRSPKPNSQIPGNPNAPPPSKSDIEQFFDSISPDLLAGLSVGLGIEQFLSILYELNVHPDDFFRNIDDYLKSTGNAIDDYLKRIRFGKLSRVSMRFKLYYRFILKWLASPGEFLLIVRKLGMILPNTLKSLGENLIGGANRVFQLLSAVKSIPFNAATLATKALERAKSIALAAGRAAVSAVAGLTAVDVFFIAVSIIGAVLDSQNIGWYMNFDQYKTSDFLSIQKEQHEKFIDALKQSVNLEISSPSPEDYAKGIPFIMGPLEGVSDLELQIRIQKLLGLNKPPNPFLPGQENLYRSFRVTSDVFEGYTVTETNPQLIKLRQIQDRMVRTFATGTPPSPIPQFYYTSLALKMIGQTKDNGDYDSISEIALYSLCVTSGGNPLGSGSCSHRNADACQTPDDKYYRSLLNSSGSGDGSLQVVVPKSGTPLCITGGSSPKSPCKSNFNEEFDDKDFMYSEWRTLEHAKRLYTDRYDGYDYTQDSNAKRAGGVCVLADPTVRQLCESTIRDNAVPGARWMGTGYNKYNKLTGECTNDKSFCDAYAVQFNPAMSRGDLGESDTTWIASSDTLPSCENRRSVLDDAVGGHTIVAGSTDVLRAWGEAFQCKIDFMGIFEAITGMCSDLEDARRRAQENAKNISIAESRTEQSQIERFFPNDPEKTYLLDDTLTFLSLKIDDVTGSIYMAYAYGSVNGNIFVRKFDEFFVEVDQGTKRITFQTIGSIQEYVNIIDVDKDGNFYFIENEVDKSDLTKQTQKIKRRRVDDFSQNDQTDFTEILSTKALDPQSIYKEQKITGLFVDSGDTNRIYYMFKCTKKTGMNTDVVSKLFYKDLDGGSFAQEVDRFPDTLDLFRVPGPTNVNINSFGVVSQGQYVVTLDYGNGITILHGGRIANFYTLALPSSISPIPGVELRYMGFTCNKNNIYISNKLTCVRMTVDGVVLNSWSLVYSPTSTKMVYPDPVFPSKNWDPIKIQVTTDEQDEDTIHAIWNMNNYVRTEESGYRITRSLFLPEYNLVRSLTVSGGIKLEIDGIHMFSPIKFSNCYDTEKVSYEVEWSDAIRHLDVVPATDLMFKINDDVNTNGEVQLPREPNKYKFDPTKTYTIRIKVRGDIVLELSNIKVDTKVFMIENLNTLELVPSVNRIRFNSAVTGFGTRVFDYKITDLSGSIIINWSPLIYGEKTATLNSSLRVNTTYNVELAIPWYMTAVSPSSVSQSMKTFTLDTTDVLGRYGSTIIKRLTSGEQLHTDDENMNSITYELVVRFVDLFEINASIYLVSWNESYVAGSRFHQFTEEGILLTQSNPTNVSSGSLLSNGSGPDGEFFVSWSDMVGEYVSLW